MMISAQPLAYSTPVPAGKTDIEDVPGTQLIRRIANLMRMLTLRNRTGARLVDLCEDSGLGKSTVHRILQGLIAEGLVTQDHGNKRYFLGKSIYEMGLAAAPRQQLRDLCHPLLQTIAMQAGDTAYLNERAGFDGVCLDRQDGSYPIKAFVLEPGHRRPLQVGCGNLSMLAALPEDQIRRICTVNRERTQIHYPQLTDAEIMCRIQRTQRDGYALIDAMKTAGVRSVGMCIRDETRMPVGAISVAALSTRLQGRHLDNVIEFIAEVVREAELRIRRVWLKPSRIGALER